MSKSDTDDRIARRRAELDLEIEHLNVSERYVKAKQAGDRKSKEFKAAQKALVDFRAKWRGIRDYLAPPAEGEVRPAPHGTTAKVRER